MRVRVRVGVRVSVSVRVRVRVRVRVNVAGHPSSAMASESLRLLPPEYAPATTSAYGSSEVWRSMAATSAPMRASGRFLRRANMRSVSRPVISSRSGSCWGQ